MLRAVPARLLLVCVLGALTMLALAMALAAWRPIPMYPRTHFNAFVHGDRAWGTAEVRHLGIVDRWWHNLVVNERIKSAREVLAMISRHADPVATVAAYRESLNALRAERPDAVLIDSPPRWGTFAPGSTLPDPRHTFGSDTAFGWPLPCLWYQVLSTYDPITLSTTSDRLEGGIYLRGSVSCLGRDFHALPLRPIWTGLAVNTLTFAALWSIPLFALPLARRAHRRRRGRCAACGYSLAWLAATACPECGAPVPGSP